MAYSSTLRTAAPSLGLRARISGLLGDLAERRSRYKLYRQTMDELNTLSSRELADLGLHRSQLKSIALEAAYGK